MARKNNFQRGKPLVRQPRGKVAPIKTKSNMSPDETKAKVENPMQQTKAEYTDNVHRWRWLRTACEGSDAIKRLIPREFLPQMSGMTEEDYNTYLEKALWYNATGRTAEAYKGMILAVPPQYNLPPELDKYSDNIDGAGTTWDSFCEKLIDEKIKVGRDVICVDFTAADPTNKVEARPVFKIYTAEQLRNWNVGVVNGAVGYTMIVLVEEYEKPADSQNPFSLTRYERWLGYWIDENGECQLNIYDTGEDSLGVQNVELKDGKGKPLRIIPVVVSGTKGIEYGITSKPILLDLLEVNKSHFNDSAEYEWAKFFVASPIPVITGAGTQIEYETNDFGQTVEKPKQEFKVGASQAWVFSASEAKATYLSIDGNGLATFENSMKAKENMMATLGARVLQEDKKAAEAAETAAIKRASENSVLADLANTASEAIRKAVEIFMVWIGRQPVKIDFAFNNEFSPKGVEPTMLTAMVSALQGSTISYATFYENLKSAGFKFANENADAEKSVIETEKPADDLETLPRNNNNSQGNKEE